MEELLLLLLPLFCFIFAGDINEGILTVVLISISFPWWERRYSFKRGSILRGWAIKKEQLYRYVERKNRSDTEDMKGDHCYRLLFIIIVIGN